ncbi:MAG TPA: c-type cytochrome [Candidatus Acidoferrum sp.]|nr:c-type cytochrome [Candidatus Acidoferrum sp.]
MTFGRRCIAVAGLLAWASLFLAVTGAQGQRPRQSVSEPQGPSPAIAEGRQAFESRCAGCHGLDGRGGERAPDVATRASVQRLSDTELFKIIQRGMPAAGMPSFATLDSSRIHALVSYLRLLQGKTGGSKVAGDPQKGKALFYGKARCADCHMLDGAGGFIASDLSSYGRTRAPEEIRDAITKPSGTSRGVVAVTTRDGQNFSGVLRNEDNFSLQLQTRDGVFHLFVKSDVADVAHQAEPLMPSDYGSLLNKSEIDDLISYMVSAARNSKSETPSRTRRNRGDEDED